MTALHLIAAAISTAAALLYGERSVWLACHGRQDTVWAIANRAAWFGVPVVLAGAFTQLGIEGAPFEARHYFAAAILAAVCVTHVGLRGKSPT